MGFFERVRKFHRALITHDMPETPAPVADPDLFSTTQNYNRLSDILPWTGYMPDEQLFVLEGAEPGSVDGIAFGIEMLLQTGANEDMSLLLREIFRDAPVGTGIQISLFGSPDIRQWLSAFASIVQPARLETDDQRALIRKMTANRVSMYKHGTEYPLISSRPNTLRTFRAVLSVVIPANEISQSVIKKAVDLRATQVSKLKTYHQFDRVWQAEDLIQWVRTLINPDSDNLENPIHYDDGQLLRYQMVEHDTVAHVGENGIRITASNGVRRHALAWSVQGYPSTFDLYQAEEFLGDATRGSLGYPCPFVITFGAEIIDYEKDKNLTQIASARAIQLANSPMGKFMPELGKRADDWSIMQHAYDNGSGALHCYHQILLLPLPDQIAQASEAVTAIWRSAGFAVSNDVYMQVQSLMASLPMSLSPTFVRDLKVAQRFSTKTFDNAANMLPVLGEWRGCGRPVIPFIGRHGQVMGVNLFDNPSGNYNAIVVGTSGSGKSAFLNELARRYLAMGARIWIIDVGKSYEKFCHAMGGQFVEFGKDSGIVLNPWTMIDDINDDMPMIKPLFAQMISPSRALTDYESSQLEIALRAVWTAKGSSASVDDLAYELLNNCATGRMEHDNPNIEPSCDPRIRDMGVQLASYCEGGQYARYFAGRHTINFNSNLVVLELEELNSKKDLQLVVLFVLMYQITHEMYLAPREQPKIVIMDEAWDLMTGGSTGDFIEAGYRRSRKYGGSFITGTQGIDDYDRSPSSKAALANADWMFLLRQKPESIQKMEKGDSLAFTQDMLDKVKSIRTEQGSYSEVFISAGQTGYGIGIVKMDPYSMLMGSANARDYEATKAKTAAGLSMADAIDAVLSDRGVVTHG